VVASLSYGATGLSVGQRVFGLPDWTRDGTLAEYPVVEARNLAPLPGDIDFTVGAAVAMTGLTAWQGLFEHGRLRVGQSVLVHGAARRGRLDGNLARTRGRRTRHRHRTRRRPADRTRLRRAHSSSTSTTTPWKTSAESTWCSTSSAATSRSGLRVWFDPLTISGASRAYTCDHTRRSFSCKSV
jgi:D-arabinose 1-dehydrogenase-like Zn-dependent alcohol dehydrogenase